MRRTWERTERIIMRRMTAWLICLRMAYRLLAACMTSPQMQEYSAAGLANLADPRISCSVVVLLYEKDTDKSINRFSDVMDRLKG